MNRKYMWLNEYVIAKIATMKRVVLSYNATMEDCNTIIAITRETINAFIYSMYLHDLIEYAELIRFRSDLDKICSRYIDYKNNRKYSKRP